jgi:hypothetical protein
MLMARLRQLRGGVLARKLRLQRGNVLPVAMLVIGAMMMLGLAAISSVDNSTGQSRKERERESTFNLTEGVLTSQTFVLGRNGTGSPSLPFPNKCTPDSTEPLCPHAAELARSFDGASQRDFAAGSVWETRVRDNQDTVNSRSDFYDPSLTDSDCSASDSDHIYCWDQNGDDNLWVRATSTVRKRTRTIVALIHVERRPVNLPQFALLGGSFQTSNNGRKVIVDTFPSVMAVRCSGAPAPDSTCLGYDPGKGQLSPPNSYDLGYPNQPAVTEDDLLSLEDSARGAGTYFATCAANPNGKIVYIKSGNCAYNNSAPAAQGQSKCCNSAANPGLLVVENGTVTLTGNIEFHGVIYAVNSQNSTGTVVETGGTSLIKGGVIIDGNGRMTAGSSGLNIDFESNAFAGINTTGTAGVVQNTWRELPAD